MGFNQRSAVPLDPALDPLLPIADSSQGHDIVTGVAPSLAKEQDWIAWLRAAGTITDQWRVLHTHMVNETSGAASSFTLTVEPTGQGSQLVPFPNGTVIDGLRVYVDRASSGSIPGTKLNISLWKRAIATGADTAVRTFYVDPSATSGDYNAYHAVEVLFTDAVMTTDTHIYYVRVDGENTPDEADVDWKGSAVRVSLASPSYI